ncbi:SusC/RagA family TonB-linked outer membrane protein [Arachidicoccus terrestris]|uniref:SusC/RagA family TonB-linked outer membrane protein n=1 Tax=Arachidicoccus terrestris TaxID=2875539 RepID=UPI001CC3A054|nr:TonB-dependent receptor [Arachidicoccus terrestris]UAY54524.1 TonB-dependent receptor [Arachidicoccus terrestris]
MKRIILLLTFTWISALLFSQKITGLVTTETGTPMQGVSVIAKDAKGIKLSGVVTDAFGKFIMEFSQKQKPKSISFTMTGYILVERAIIAGQDSMHIILKEDENSLNDVVVVGYGTVQRKDLTGSVVSINEEELKDLPATSALQAIQGRLAGVNVTVTEGSPDAAINVRVRGGGSITQDNSPLYIVDGFQVPNINDIAPQDIKTIDVLKDAASTAIYGAQGANGVILITTKSGSAGKSDITFNNYTALSHVYRLTDVLSPYEYVYYQRELDPSMSENAGFFGSYGKWDDIDIYKSKPGINWQDSLFDHTGVQQSYNVGLSGGDRSLTYNLNYTHDQEDFIMLNSTYKRDYFSGKLKKIISPKLTFDFNARMYNTVITGPSVSSGKKLRDAVKYAPVRSLTAPGAGGLGSDEDATSAEALSSLNDPIYNIVNEYRYQNRFNSTFNAGITWKIAHNLTFTSKGSYAFVKDYTDNIFLNKTGESSANGGQPVARRNDEKGYMWSVSNVLDYRLNLNGGKHRLNAIVGQELSSRQSNETALSSKFFPIDFTADDVLAMWNYGTPDPTYTTIGEPSRLSSFFSRINYIYNDKYILTLIGRTDGKNVFAPGHQWGFFPGVAGAWRLSDEGFMKGMKGWLSDAKIRLSYGDVGNARVGSYWRQQYSFISQTNRLIYFDDKAQSALRTSSTLKNENLTWESTTSANLGLDLAFLDNRLTFTMDLYNNTTRNLILNVALPSSSGYVTQYQNIGSTRNRGLEFSVNGNLVNTKDFNLSASFNIAFNRNKVLELNGADEMIVSSGWGVNIGSDDYRAIVGQPVGLMYGYVSDGFYTFDDFDYSEELKRWVIKPGVADASKVLDRSGNYFGPGHMKFKKLHPSADGDNFINADDDRRVIGHAQPKHTGGFSFNASYKSFDLTTMFNWSYGNDIYNADKIDYTTYALSKRYQNISTLMSLENRFTTIDPATGANIMFGNDANPELFRELNKNARIWSPMMTNSSIISDWAIEDGSFLRLSNVTLGYTLPQKISKKFLIEDLRVYVAGYNIFVWTHYSGQDPEVSTRNNPLTQGVDYSAYPKSRKILFGLNVRF